jgi:DNA-binding MarR family transcriptional regulator
MAPAGLRLTQVSLLRTLAARGPVRNGELAASLLLDRTALSRNLDPLVALGLVEIVRGGDARTREVALARKGAAALRRAEPYWKRAQHEVAQRVGPDKLDALIEVLGELEALHPANVSSDSHAPASTRPRDVRTDAPRHP